MLVEIPRFSAEIGGDFCSDFCTTRRLMVLWLSMVSVDNLKSKGRSKAPIGVTAKLTLRCSERLEWRLQLREKVPVPGKGEKGGDKD